MEIDEWGRFQTCSREVQPRRAGRSALRRPGTAFGSHRDPSSSSPTARQASALLGERACHQPAARLRLPTVDASKIHFQPYFWTKSPEASFQEESMEPPNFILLSYCLFKEQSSKIKISSSGKKNLIQTFLRTDSTTFPPQTKQNKTQPTKLLHSWSLAILTMNNNNKRVEGECSQERLSTHEETPEWQRIGCIPENDLSK